MTEQKTLDAENKLDDTYDTIKSSLSFEQKKAVEAYKQVLGYLGIDVLKDPQNPVLSPDRAVTDASYLSLTTDQLMYYIGVLCGVRPYLCEELTDSKARAIYATVWRKFNEFGFKVNYRKDKLSKEIEELQKKIESKSPDEKTAEKGKKAVSLAVKKHYTEESLKDEAGWRTYTWSKIEGEKIRKAELLTQYVMSIDNLIVALKERIRYTQPEFGQSKFGDQTNTLTP